MAGVRSGTRALPGEEQVGRRTCGTKDQYGRELHRLPRSVSLVNSGLRRTQAWARRPPKMARWMPITISEPTNATMSEPVIDCGFQPKMTDESKPPTNEPMRP